MNELQAVMLGIVQGFAEFLPISSSGHLVLAQRLLGFNEPILTFDIVLHLGSLVAVFIVFWSDIWALLKHPAQKRVALLILATLPAVVVALLFGDVIKLLFGGGVFLGVGFIITGIFLIYSDRAKNREKTDDDMGIIDALVIGCMQAVGVAPGVSRSGSTITGALARGLNRDTAARFSFLLSIPTILGAAVFTFKEAADTGIIWDEIFTLPMAFGFAAAALSGYLSIRFMLALIKKCKLRYFAIYVFAIAGFVFFNELTHMFY
ncbi:MAG: undecaprenyl-diphosphate phosphatase [Clostridiales bacterium]|nr:undecaprenyl-diphosphate phosphatase [Clostridiales bacterium]